MNTLKIISLEIKEWRSLSNCSINFNDNLNEITGKNGSGKSSILDAIRFLLFSKDENDKRANNYKVIKNDQTEYFPSLEMVISFNNKNVSLKYENNTWYIDNIKCANNDSYKKQLAKLLNIEEIDFIYDNVNPNNLYDTFISYKSESKDARNRITKIVNTMLPDEEKFDSHSLNELIFEISDLEGKKSSIEKDIKLNASDIKNFEENNSEIKDWNITNTNFNDSTIQELYEKKDKWMKHSELKNNIYSKEASLKSRLFEINQKIDSQDLKLNSSKNKISILKIILLTLITFGFYLIILKKNKKLSNNESITSLYKERKNIEEQILILNKEYDNLKKSPLENEDINEITRKISSFDLDKNNNELFDNKRHRRNKMIQEDVNLKNKLNEIHDKLQINKNKLYRIQQKVNNVLKESFSDFEINLFDKNGGERFEIIQNGINLKFLNHSNKYNIIFQLNEFLKKDSIKTFVLIDQGEAFNSIDIKHSTQIICAKVNMEAIKINGNNIN